MKKQIMLAMLFCMLLLVGSTSVFAIQFGTDSYTVPNWGKIKTGTVYVECDGGFERKSSFNVTYSNTSLSKRVALASGETLISKWVDATPHQWLYPVNESAAYEGRKYNSKARSHNMEPTNNTKITYQFSPDYLPYWQ